MLSHVTQHPSGQGWLSRTHWVNFRWDLGHKVDLTRNVTLSCSQKSVQRSNLLRDESACPLPDAILLQHRVNASQGETVEMLKQANGKSRALQRFCFSCCIGQATPKCCNFTMKIRIYRIKVSEKTCYLFWKQKNTDVCGQLYLWNSQYVELWSLRVKNVMCTKSPLPSVSRQCCGNGIKTWKGNSSTWQSQAFSKQESLQDKRQSVPERSAMYCGIHYCMTSTSSNASQT